MKTEFYYQGKKITKKKAVEILGEKRFKERLQEAKETFFEDPYILNQWADSFTIIFK